MYRTIALCQLVASCTILGALTAQNRSDPREDSLRARYPALFDSRWIFRDPKPALDSVPVDSIVLERSACFGRCPVYRAVLYRDGLAVYHGKAHVQRSGIWRGIVPQRDFERLAFLAEYIHFAALDSSYSENVTDLPGTWITVGWRGSRGSQTVYEYGWFGPPRLEVFGTVIDAVIDGIKWVKPF